MSRSTTACLTCVQCTHDFPININVKPESIVCPFCQSKVDTDMIERIYQAALSVADVNYHFRKYASEYDENIFELSVKEQEVTFLIDRVQ